MNELSPKFELHRTRIENIPPFSATRAFFEFWYSSTRQNVKLIDNGACEDIIPRKAFMRTPTPKKGDGKSIVKCGRSKGSVCITTPEKGKISRHFQSLGGESVAAATARKFSLSNPSSSGGSVVKKYDQKIKKFVMVWLRV